MNIHLVGQSHISAIDSPLPATQSSRLLDDTRTLPYRRAFARAPMPLNELLPLLEHHLRAAAQDAGWTPEHLRNIPIFLGSTVYVIADREARIAAGETLSPRYTLSEIAAHLRTRLPTPHIYSLATSCTASAHGIAQAATLLHNCQADRALVLGFETYNRMTLDHFHALNLTSDHPEHPGIILGEAIAAIALAREHPAPRATLRHIATHTDSANLTATHPEALRTLLSKLTAHTPADQLQSIKIHGAGGIGDADENTILNQHLPHLPRIRYKPQTGHTLGASAALETALTLQHPPPAGRHLHYYLGFGGSNIGWILQCP